MVGFHGRQSETVVDDRRTACVVRPEIARGAAGAARPDVASRRQPVRGTLRLTVTSGPAGLDVDGRRRRAARRRRCGSELAACAEAADLARLAWDGEPVATAAAAVPADGAGAGRPAARGLPAGDRRGRGARWSRRCARRRRARARVADLFAGCGTFTLPLAARAEVLAVEGDAGDAGGAGRGRRGARRGCGAVGGRGARPLPPAAAARRARRLRGGGDRPAARRGGGAEPRAAALGACRGSRRSPATPRPSPATRASWSTAATGSTGSSRSTSSAGRGTWSSRRSSAGEG